MFPEFIYIILKVSAQKTGGTIPLDGAWNLSEELFLQETPSFELHAYIAGKKDIQAYVKRYANTLNTVQPWGHNTPPVERKRMSKIALWSHWSHKGNAKQLCFKKE